MSCTNDGETVLRPGRRGFTAIVFLFVGAAGSVAADRPERAADCPRCGWAPPATSTTCRVSTVRELTEAVRRARTGSTILLEDGVYLLDRMIDLNVPALVLRSRSGQRSQVILRGGGIDERTVGVALSISAAGVVLADLTVGAVGFHGVQVRGERSASKAVLHNVLVMDTGQQLVKGSAAKNGRSADHGLIACSSFQYSEHAPSDYTNGVDFLNARGWVIRDNYFLRIRGPRERDHSAGPAILFWGGSGDTIVERNLVLDCSRGIALGLIPTANDHRGGVIRNNLVVNLNAWADEGIEANNSPGVRIEHNTVLVEGRLPWSISLRFAGTEALVSNNLTSRSIILRDGAHARLRGNVADARATGLSIPGAGSSG